MVNIIVITVSYLVAVLFSIRAFRQMCESSIYKKILIHPSKKNIAETICKNSQEALVAMIFLVVFLQLLSLPVVLYGVLFSLLSFGLFIYTFPSYIKTEMLFCIWVEHWESALGLRFSYEHQAADISDIVDYFVLVHNAQSKLNTRINYEKSLREISLAC